MWFLAELISNTYTSETQIDEDDDTINEVRYWTTLNYIRTQFNIDSATLRKEWLVIRTTFVVTIAWLNVYYSTLITYLHHIRMSDLFDVDFM